LDVALRTKQVRFEGQADQAKGEADASMGEVPPVPLKAPNPGPTLTAADILQSRFDAFEKTVTQRLQVQDQKLAANADAIKEVAGRAEASTCEIKSLLVAMAARMGVTPQTASS
jgi:hypothetical protein